MSLVFRRHSLPETTQGLHLHLQPQKEMHMQGRTTLHVAGNVHNLEDTLRKIRQKYKYKMKFCKGTLQEGGPEA